MASPLVHVLVINWNGLEHLQICFKSLLASTYSNVRFVLIDNGSTDGSVAFVRDNFGDDERVQVLRCGENLGWSGGNNVGLRAAQEAGADYVFLLNNDTATAEDAIEKLVAMAEARPEAGALAPKMLLYDCPFIINSMGLVCSVVGASWDVGIGRLDGARFSESNLVAGVCGGACFLRTAVLAKTGLLPEDFEIYMDDLDLCLRIWDAGYEVRTCPDAQVRHKFSATLGHGAWARRKYYLNTRNRFRVIIRNFPLWTWFMVKPAVVVGECRAVGRALLDGEPWRVWAHFRAWFSGAGYLPRGLWEALRRRRAGVRRGRFWQLVLKRPMFCPGAAIPDRGWYGTRVLNGLEVRPMSSQAWEDVPGGRLRVRAVNCYPQLGDVEVRVHRGGTELAFLSTAGEAEVILDSPGGRIDFGAERIFEAEQTGEIMDLGGWISITTVKDGQT